MGKGSKSAREVVVPSLEQLEQERSRLRFGARYKRAMRSTVAVLVVVAAVAILVATLWLPVLRIQGSSMAPTLQEGEIVVALKGDTLATGDVVAFWFGNKLLVKRCIAAPGQWVDIDEAGNVSVDGKAIDEPYLTQKAKGECDLKFPYQVPESRWFLMGDNRATSLDSRSLAVGCINADQVVGRIVLRVWPFDHAGAL